MPEEPVITGTTPGGLRYATEGSWRILAYAQGGYTRQRRGIEYWLIDPTMPPDVEGRLKKALNLE